MGRKILAVVAGYAAMAVLVMVVFSLALATLGTSLVFVEGTTRPSGGWLAFSLVVSLVAAAAGGWVAARIGHQATAAKILAGVVLILGLIMAVAQPERDPERAQQIIDEAGGVEGVAMGDLADIAEQPAWFAWVIPFLGAAGVLVGGSSAGRGSATA